MELISLIHFFNWNTHKEGWELKNWCFRIVVLEKTLESPSHCKEIKPVSPQGNQSWIFTGRSDVEAEAPILWPPDVEELTHWKRPWCWERLKAGRGERATLTGMASLYDIIDSMDVNLSKLWEIVKEREGRYAVVQGVAKSQTQLSDWTTVKS